MPKKKTPELDPKEQFERFQETAKALGVDKAANEVEAQFQRISSQKKKPHASR